VPRGTEKNAGTPYRIWTATVEAQNRVRVSLTEISEIVTWITTKSGAIDCFGMPGAAGGVQFQPMETAEDVQREFLESLGQHDAGGSDAGEKWVDAARLFATVWPASISVENSRISLTLPEPARRALQLPGVGETAVVFGFGRILEVWIAPRWYDHVRELSRQRVSLLARAMDDLGQR
jgi:hypothetical protein